MENVNLKLDRPEIESVLDEILDEQPGFYSESGSEFEFGDHEADLNDLEWDPEIKRGKRGFNRPSGRRSRPARRRLPREKKTPQPPPRPIRPGDGLWPKPKPRPPKPSKRPIVIRHRRRRPVVISEPAAPCVCPAHGTEFVRWVQSSLNQILGLNIRINGVMNRATSDALRDFQKREGLPIDGIAGPETEKALITAKNQGPSTEVEFELSDSEIAYDDDYPSRETEEEFSFFDFPSAVLKVLRRGLEKGALKLAVRFGTHEENKLSDLIFFSRFPARGGRLLKKGEPDYNALRQKWLKIRDVLVRPIVARAFFAEFELNGNPTPGCSYCIEANNKLSRTEKKKRIDDVLKIKNELDVRLDKRAAAALKRKLLPVAPVPSSLHANARRLSDVQLRLFKDFFPTSTGGINFKALQFAFELFANGELRDSSRTDGFGEPDSAYYFHFGGFAFLCIDSKIEKTLWAKALRAFVKTEEIFMHIYRESPHPAPPPVGVGLPSPGRLRRDLIIFDHSNFDASGQSSDSRKKKLRAKYDRMSVSALRRAARDNLLRAQRML